MACRISHTTIDCANAYELSTWWREVLGYVADAEDPDEPGDEECLILDAESGHRILFIEVPEPKTVKNRLHFDLCSRTGTRNEEIERLRSLGAVEVSDHRGQYGPGTGWVTFADPEGNEFCVVRSEDEIAAGTSA